MSFWRGRKKAKGERERKTQSRRWITTTTDKLNSLENEMTARKRTSDFFWTLPTRLRMYLTSNIYHLSFNAHWELNFASFWALRLVVVVEEKTLYSTFFHWSIFAAKSEIPKKVIYASRAWRGSLHLTGVSVHKSPPFFRSRSSWVEVKLIGRRRFWVARSPAGSRHIPNLGSSYRSKQQTQTAISQFVGHSQVTFLHLVKLSVSSQKGELQSDPLSLELSFRPRSVHPVKPSIFVAYPKMAIFGGGEESVETKGRFGFTAESAQ